MKKIITMKIMEAINFVALVLAVKTANTTCAWILGQPKKPEEAKKMRKF